jgi:hypothetical protein
VIKSEPPPDPPITLAFDLIRRYAERQGWIPIGWRPFTVGPWDVTVNGTPEERDDIPPWHARIVHRDIIAFLLIHPFGGKAAGWRGAEEDFIRDMEAALISEPFVRSES